MCKIVPIYIIILTLTTGCVRTNEEKWDFIHKNIEKTNKIQIEKYTKLIIPDLMFKKDAGFSEN